MFLDIVEFRLETKEIFLGKTVLVICYQICGQMAKIVCQIFYTTQTFMGQILVVTYFVTQFTHVSRHPSA